MKARLLIVDDDPGALELFRAALSDDFEVECAAGGEDGVAACRRRPPAVLLLDHRMPRAGGLEVLARLGLEEATRDVPVVVFSSSPLDGSVRRALAERPNVRRVLDKVCDFRRFRSALREAAGS